MTRKTASPELGPELRPDQVPAQTAEPTTPPLPSSGGAFIVQDGALVPDPEHAPATPAPTL